MSRATCVLDVTERDGERVRRTRLRSRRAILRALTSANRRQMWVLESEQAVEDLLRVLPFVDPGVCGPMLICHANCTPSGAQMIESKFARTLMRAPAVIPLDDLAEILGTRHPEDYCVGVDWDPSVSLLAIWRGDLTTIVLPLDVFPARAGVSPDPTRLSVEDCGQTVRLGEYEVSVDAILFERDALYRRRAKKRLIASEQGLGPSIRRLRISRGVSRSAFPGLDERTLARIERGEVNRPHARTLRTIAARLGVAVERLDDY